MIASLNSSMTLRYKIDTSAQSVFTLYFSLEPCTGDVVDGADKESRDIPEGILCAVRDVYSGLRQLRAAANHRTDFAEFKAVIDIVPANHSISLMYDDMQITHYQMKTAIDNVVAQICTQLATGKPSSQPNGFQFEFNAQSSRQRCLPVYYGEEVAWDLAELSRLSGLTQQEIVETHQSAKYRVCAVGFAPGFAYMQGLARSLQFPRLAQPRVRVLPGAVAIAEHQTAIYPQASPAGWRIVGHCPIPLFQFNAVHNPHSTPLDSVQAESVLSMGDEVTFKMIEKEDYLDLLQQNSRYFGDELRQLFPEIDDDGEFQR